MEQRTRFKIVIYAILGVIALFSLFVWIWRVSGWRRDFQRVGDLKQIQIAMSHQFSQYGTYSLFDCRVGMKVGDCFSKQPGVLKSFEIADPLSSGYYDYFIGSMNDDFYEINFSLEAGVGGLPAGRYILTKDGVRR